MTSLIPLPLEISHADPEMYLLPHVNRLVLDESLEGKTSRIRERKLKKITKGYLESLRYAQYPEVTAIDDSGFGEKTLEQLSAYRSKMSDELLQAFPLIEDEVVESVSLYYLTRSWDAFPGGCCVLKRVTNFSESLFIDPGTCYEGSQGELSGRNHLEELAAAEGNEVDYAAVARRIAGLLANHVGGKVGSLILEIVWPSGSSAAEDWKYALKQIRQIVKRELDRRKIDNATDRARGFLDFHATRYVHQRRDPKVKKEELLSSLEAHLHDFYTVIVSHLAPDLGDKAKHEFAVLAFANFLLGANLQLAVLQEIARLTRRESDIRTIRSVATTRASYAAKMEDVMLKYRLGFITEVESHCSYPLNYYSFVDKFEGKESPRFYFGKEGYIEAKKAAEQNRWKVIRAITSQKKNAFANNVRPIIDNWRKLAKDPLPKPEEFEIANE